MNLLRFKLTYFVHKECGSSWRLGRQLFAPNGLALILEGSADYVIDGAPYHVTAGDLVFMHPGCTREASTPGMTVAAFDFETTGEFSLPTVSRFHRSEELLRLIRSFQYEWVQPQSGRELKCPGVFLLILHELLFCGDRPGANHHVEKVKRYVVQHYAEDFNRDTLAAHVGLSAVYIGSLFRRREGITVSEYLARIRIYEAAALIDEDVHNLTEIAFLCGFHDLGYFSNTFKRIMGSSPSQYKSRPTSAVLREERARHLERLRD